MQVTSHFYDRPYWQNPVNLAEPFNENAQPPQQTWRDCAIERVGERITQVEGKYRSQMLFLTRLQEAQNDQALRQEVAREAAKTKMKVGGGGGGGGVKGGETATDEKESSSSHEGVSGAPETKSASAASRAKKANEKGKGVQFEGQGELEFTL